MRGENSRKSESVYVHHSDIRPAPPPATMRLRSAASGRRPVAALMFSRTWATRVVAGIAQVTAGCETMNFSTSWAQLAQSISAAHGGKRLPCQRAQQRAFAERPVDDHRDAAIARERQDALLDLAVEPGCR